jgi:preprotein translocase subunit SecF
MEFFKQNTKIDFMRLRKITAVFSIILFVFSVGCLLMKGLNWGLDFTGGTQVHLTFPQTVDIAQVRSSIDSAGFQKFSVQSYGSTKDVLITIAPNQVQKTQLQNQNEVTQLTTAKLLTILPHSTLESANSVGAKVSGELATKGLLAVIIAMILIMIYVGFRFEYRMAISSVVALIHDPILILGIFSFFQIQFDLTALAAVLTVMGYSLNDTIVVFDRVRENFRKMRKASPLDVVNASINQTLSRTIMTSTLTLVVILALFFLGGPTIHSFAIALIIGIIIGTYSSIYVAGALAVGLGLTHKDLLPSVKKESDEEQLV